MYTSETTVRVRYAETDQMDVVYHGNYATYFEVGRVESIRQLGISYKSLEEMGIIMPVVEWHAKFLRPAHYDDLLTVRTMLRSLPTDHRIVFEQEVYNEKGKLLMLSDALDLNDLLQLAGPVLAFPDREGHPHTKPGA